MHQKNSLKVGDTIGLVRMGHKDLYIAKHRPWDEKGNKIMNIEIGNTTQTFELENEVIWHLKEKKNEIWNNSAAFYANYNSFKNRDVFWMFRISRLHQIFEIHASDLSWYIVDRTLRTNPLTIISFIEEFSDILEPIIFFSWSSFLHWWFRYPSW